MGNLLIDYTVITVGRPPPLRLKMLYIPPLMYFSIEHRCCIMIGSLYRMWDTRLMKKECLAVCSHSSNCQDYPEAGAAGSCKIFVHICQIT